MKQKEALDILKTGANVFLTGPAGSGKTFVLNEYINYLKENNVPVAITASTGIAATHLGGVTIHSWSGLGIRDYLTEYDVENLLEKEYLFNRHKKTKVLIIDEISMLSANQLSMVEYICRAFKGNGKVFGGMQIIFCGDFFQLPPISKNENEVNFAFLSPVWESLNINICYLSENHRHKESSYLSVLNKIRSNKIDSDLKDFLESKIKIKNKNDSTEVTKLFTHNADVDRINKEHLSKIKSESYVFKMVSKGNDFLVENLKKSCLAPENLELKIGAKVMFVKNNYDQGFVNGSLGKVSGFNSFGEPIVRLQSGKSISVVPSTWQIEEDGKVKASISQLPLRLAWAITVHKSQGMSLDQVEVDLCSAFTLGQGYVALSRVRSSSGLSIIGFNEKSLMVDPVILEKDFEFKEVSLKTVNYLNKISQKELSGIQKNFIDSISQTVKEKESPKDKTLDLILQKKSLDEIAKERKVKKETIISDIEKILENDTSLNLSFLKKEFKYGELEDILKIFKKTKGTILAPVMTVLKKEKKNTTYLKLRIARLFLENS